MSKLHKVSINVNNKRREYSVAVSTAANWDDMLHFMVILNKHGKSVFKEKNNGNRIAVLINVLYLQGMTCSIMHNGYEYIYVPSKDIFVSRATKKICWEDKNNPQRMVLAKNALTKFLNK